MLHAPVMREFVGKSPALVAGNLPRRLAQTLFLLALAGGVIVGFVLPDPAASARAIASAGPDLTRLLRFMAGIKSLLVIGAASVVFWRLNDRASVARFAAYAGLTAVMAAGLGEIWQMAHVGLGALMLHGGLAATAVLVWFDPCVHQRLAMAVSQRRQSRD
jgi:hypothetical protein